MTVPENCVNQNSKSKHAKQQQRYNSPARFMPLRAKRQLCERASVSKSVWLLYIACAHTSHMLRIHSVSTTNTP